MEILKQELANTKNSIKSNSTNDRKVGKGKGGNNTNPKVGNLPTKKVGNNTNLTDAQVRRMVQLYHTAKNAINGDHILCPACEIQFEKSRNKIYCSSWKNKRPDGGNCSDDYKNGVDPKRLKALANKRRKQRMATA